jgi:hypoxanthine phosphoribosyltransferase
MALPNSNNDNNDIDLPSEIREVAKRATCLHSGEDVRVALDKMAAEIHEKLSDSNPVMLCVMVGGFIPAGHLLTRLDFPIEVDYVHATRYKSGLRGGEIHWRAEPKTQLKDRTVIIVDDILDGGLTLSAVVDYCRDQGAAEVYTAALVDKEHVREPGGLEKADFTGLVVEDRYVFGFGLDYKEYLRNADGIYAVAPEHEA